jgi:hypothetical protein
MRAHSFDGTHYGQQVNVPVSQVLLNHVAEVESGAEAVAARAAA